MRDWLKKAGQVAVNTGGKVTRGVAHVIRVGAEKSAELAGAGVNAVSEVAASAVGLVSERGEQVVQDTGKTIVKVIETPGKTIGQVLEQGANIVTGVISHLAGDVDGETDASLAQEKAWQEYRDHWNEAWTAAKNASEGFTGEKCFKLARERFEKLRKEQVQKQQLIDIQLKQQIAVIQKKLTNINYSRDKAKNLFLEFEQLSSVFVEWKIRRYNIVECFNPRYSPFPKLKEWKEFFSEVDFDNDPWWNRLKGFGTGGILIVKQIEDAENKIKEADKAFKDKCNQAEEEIKRYQKVVKSLEFVEENFVFFTDFYNSMIRELGYSVHLLRESGYMQNMFFFANSDEKLNPAFLPNRHIRCLQACDKLSRLLCELSKRKYFNDSNVEVIETDWKRVEKYRERFVIPLQKELAA